MSEFSVRSIARLDTCHPLLQRLFKEVIKETDITILCGIRTKDEQNKAYELGHSKLKWPKSKHNSAPSMAVDVAPYPIIWTDTERFKELAVIVKKNWELIPKDEKLGYLLQWGGDWIKFKDYPHWELQKTFSHS